MRLVILLGWCAIVIRDGVIGSWAIVVKSVFGESVINSGDNELVTTEVGAGFTCDAVEVNLEVFLEVEIVTDIASKIVAEFNVSALASELNVVEEICLLDEDGGGVSGQEGHQGKGFHNLFGYYWFTLRTFRFRFKPTTKTD